jgi:DivIVA domain-containing protein
VALERHSIERKDFPIGRRGYDPEAVDSHLSMLADEIDELKRSSRRRTETLASSASEQVRSIVEAAETSAGQIQKQAEDEAREIRTEANSEAQSTRTAATEQAREYVGSVSEATAVMLQRIDAMEGELGALVESLRTGSNRLSADLQLLQGNLTELRGAATPAGRSAPAPESSFEPESGFGAPGGPPESAAVAEAIDEPAFSEPVFSYADTVPEHNPPPPAASPAAESAASYDERADDTEGARLVALNMALNGTPREETDRYLEANFRLENRSALLDEVYASV